MKMYDMGRKAKSGGELVTATPENSVRYPTLSLYDKVPEPIMKKDIGAMCRLEVMGKLVSKEIRDSANSNRRSVEFEIHKIGILDSEYKPDDKLVSNLSKRMLKR